MKERYSIAEAQAQLSALIERASEGQEIIIGEGDGPLVCLRRYETPKARRTLGALQGRIGLADDFDAADPELMRRLGLG